MMDLISIVVPAYNVEKTIRQCIDSILCQTYKKIEIILVDDGSKDETGKICDDYKKQDKRISVIHKKNEGLGMARNSGLEKSKGKYILFIDSDDYINNDYVMNLYVFMKKYNVDFCKMGFNRVDEDGNFISKRVYKFELFENDLAKNNLLPRMIGSLPDKIDSIEMSAWGTLYDNNIIKNNNIRFKSERELISEDLIFNTDYMQFANNGAVLICNSDYNYRYNPNSLTKKYRCDRFDACKKYYIYMEDKLSKLGYNEEILLRLSRILFIYIKMCIIQEKKEVSHLSKNDSIKNIKKICDDDLVNKLINNYPVKKLGIKQRLFLILIQKKKARFLLFLSNKNLI
jgi:glycosyltransferase involved in cell wall biosynthesis